MYINQTVYSIKASLIAVIGILLAFKWFNGSFNLCRKLLGADFISFSVVYVL